MGISGLSMADPLLVGVDTLKMRLLTLACMLWSTRDSAFYARLGQALVMGILTTLVLFGWFA